jgi:hypothetical protein
MFYAGMEMNPWHAHLVQVSVEIFNLDLASNIVRELVIHDKRVGSCYRIRKIEKGHSCVDGFVVQVSDQYEIIQSFRLPDIVLDSKYERTIAPHLVFLRRYRNTSVRWNADWPQDDVQDWEPPWNRRYVLYRLTDKQLEIETLRQQLFEQLVGLHNSYDDDGKRFG